MNDDKHPSENDCDKTSDAHSWCAAFSKTILTEYIFFASSDCKRYLQ